MKKRAVLECEGFRIGVFHGSPDDDDEFLFADTPPARFRDLAAKTQCEIIMAGHSHSIFHKEVNEVHFINPGSVGRMFDGNPEASYATIELAPKQVKVSHFRCPYEIEKVIRGLRENGLPPIYEQMYRTGRKLN
jgi:putative phosphoesterase